MSIFEYDKEKEEKKLRKDEYEHGLADGENLMGRLMQLLMEKGRFEDITRASTNPEVRQELYKEFHLL